MSAGPRTLVIVTALLFGCRSERKDPVAAAVTDGLARELGVAPSRVACGHSRCEVEVAGLALAVTLEGEREVAWQADEVVLTAPVVAHVQAQLADLGVDARVDCGPAIQRPPADDRLTCRIDGGGLAWVRLAADGGLDVEVALTASEVAERTGARDEVGLERASRALDSDEAEGADDDHDDDGGISEAPMDAGIDGAVAHAPGL